MADEGEQRRLAAIFAADMVGYSRLMEADERGTIARQKTHRVELIDPTIAEHHGRIVKTTGDGMLVEFASVVDAVACAAAVRRAMMERETEVPDLNREPGIPSASADPSTDLVDNFPSRIERTNARRSIGSVHSWYSLQEGDDVVDRILIGRFDCLVGLVC